MEEVILLVENHGTSAIIIGLFLWDWLVAKQDTRKSLKAIEENSKNVSACLDEMNKANTNISKSLDLLQTSLDNQTEKIDFLLNRVK